MGTSTVEIESITMCIYNLLPIHTTEIVYSSIVPQYSEMHSSDSDNNLGHFIVHYIFETKY